MRNLNTHSKHLPLVAYHTDFFIQLRYRPNPKTVRFLTPESERLPLPECIDTSPSVRPSSRVPPDPTLHPSGRSADRVRCSLLRRRLEDGMNRLCRQTVSRVTERTSTENYRTAGVFGRPRNCRPRQTTGSGLYQEPSTSNI